MNCWPEFLTVADQLWTLSYNICFPFLSPQSKLILIILAFSTPTLASALTFLILHPLGEHVLTESPWLRSFLH